MKNEKEIFEQPSMEIIQVSAEIVTTSGMDEMFGK